MEPTETMKTATNNSDAPSQTGAVVSQPSPQPSTAAASSAMSPSQKTSPQQSSAFPVMVIAQHDFPGTGDDEIAFQRGETIVVIAKDDGFGDGWWTGRNLQNQIGLFPAIYTIPYQPPTPGSPEVRPLSPQSPTPLQRSFSSESEGGVYEGLGIRSDQVYAVDSPLNHNDSSASEIEDNVATLSIQSSASSLLSTELVDAELLTTEDESTDTSIGPINPILAQIRQWSPKDVAAFIADRGFPNQAHNFIQHEISGAILLELDLAMLKEVDIAAFGIRYQIMREIEGLRKLGAPLPSGKTRQSYTRNDAVRLPVRSPTRSVTSGDEDEPYRRPPSASPSQKRDIVSPLPQFGSRPGHSRQSSYEPGTPRSLSSPRPQSMSSDPSRLSIHGTWDRQRYIGASGFRGHRSTISQDSGFGGSNHSTPEFDSGSSNSRHGGHRKSKSATGLDGISLQPGRIRVDSQDSGIGHSRHTSTDTIIKSPKNGHKRQSSSLATVRVQPPSIPLMEAAGKMNDAKELPSIPKSSTVTLPGTRSETPQPKSTPKFLIAPNSTRSPMSDRERSVSAGETNVRLVKSYTAMRRRSSSTASPVSPAPDDTSHTDLHHHRSVLLKNLPAKEAVETADFSGWLKKRTEKGTSIPGLNVGPGVGVVGGWKRRFFVLKGRRLSYYHSEKDAKEKGVIDITAHRCVTAVSAPNLSTSPVDAPTPTPARKISLTGNKFIFKVVPPAPGTSRAVTFTPQKMHIFSAENENEFRGWVEALMKANIGLDHNASVITSYTAPTISLERAKEMKSRPPALNLSNSNLADVLSDSASSTHINSDGGVPKPSNRTSTKLQTLTNPTIKKEQEVSGNFELEMEKALGKVGKSPEQEKQPILELSIPIGLH